MNLISRIKKLFSKEKNEPTPEPRPEELSEGFIILHVDSDDQIFIDLNEENAYQIFRIKNHNV